MQGTEFITQHEKMVHGLANRLRRELSLRGDLDDLIAFGFGGLLEARHRFDPGRGVRFQTFAYHRVRGAMLDGVRKMSQLPRRAHERLQAAAEATPTAAPTALDRAFTRMSAPQRRDGAPGALRRRESRGGSPQERKCHAAVAGASEPVAEAAGPRSGLLLRRPLHRRDGAGARHLQVVGQPSSHQRAPRAAGGAGRGLSESRPVSRNPCLPGRLRAQAATRLPSNCAILCALCGGCDVFGFRCGKNARSL